MSKNSSIEWTESTWNPVTGCTKVSSGCKHCYAETFAERFRGVPGHPYEQGFDLKLWPERIGLPLKWKKPQRIFVNSMSDLFQRNVPWDFVLKVFDVMNRADWHIYQVLTKRSGQLREISARIPWSPHIWMGVSVETEKYQTRIDDLRETGAVVKFLSLEPLLEPLSNLDLNGMDWVIVGGESGSGARRMHPEWVRDIRDQCKKSKVPFFFKQWGAFNSKGQRVGKKRAGRELDGRTWDEMPKEVVPVILKKIRKAGS